MAAGGIAGCVRRPLISTAGLIGTAAHACSKGQRTWEPRVSVAPQRPIMIIEPHVLTSTIDSDAAARDVSPWWPAGAWPRLRCMHGHMLPVACRPLVLCSPLSCLGRSQGVSQDSGRARCGHGGNTNKPGTGCPLRSRLARPQLPRSVPMVPHSSHCWCGTHTSVRGRQFRLYIWLTMCRCGSVCSHRDTCMCAPTNSEGGAD